MNLTRRQATIVLLESRHAWQPSLTSQFSRFGAVVGELATESAVCPKCKGAGDVNSRDGRVPCDNCDAQGTYLVDAYTGFRTAQEGAGTLRQAALSHHDLRRKRDGELQRLKEQTRPAQSEATLLAETPPFRWERERDRHYRHGSYAELSHALEWLNEQSPTAHQIVTWTYEYRIIRQPAQPVAIAALAAVDVLAGRMPDPIRVPPWLVGKQGADRRRDEKRAAA